MWNALGVWDGRRNNKEDAPSHARAKAVLVGRLYAPLGGLQRYPAPQACQERAGITGQDLALMLEANGLGLQHINSYLDD